MSHEDEDEQERGDWQFAAMVIDRLCMFMMTCCTLLSVVYILMAAPYLDAS